LLALLGAASAFAQSTSPEPTNSDKNVTREAPVGHRQPRAKDLPPDISSPNDPRDAKADEELDRKIKSICRGC
jgi:hypothetical protein